MSSSSVTVLVNARWLQDDLTKRSFYRDLKSKKRSNFWNCRFFFLHIGSFRKWFYNVDVGFWGSFLFPYNYNIQFFCTFSNFNIMALKHSDASCHVNTLAVTCVVVSCAWLQNTNDKHFLSKYCTIILPNFAVVLFLSIFQSTVNK